MSLVGDAKCEKKRLFHSTCLAARLWDRRRECEHCSSDESYRGCDIGVWYISNVSIIFYAPCLFLHHLLSVLLHFMAFLCIFWDKPVNKMPQCQFPVFCYFCVSEKLHRKYSRNWTKQQPNLLIFTEASRSPKRRRRGATGWPHHRTARPAPGPRPLVVRPPWPTSDAAPSPIKTPRREKT
jgi:hypothetical protein